MALVIAAASCGNKGRIIPDGTLSLICADMFLADQWVIDRNLVRQADTMLLYEPIFNKYGYTSLDFQVTLDKQMYDPSKFARVITQSQMIIQERLVALDKELNKFKSESWRRYDSGFRLSGVGCQVDSLELEYVQRFELITEKHKLLYDRK